MESGCAASSRLTSSFASGEIVARAGGFLYALLNACIVYSFGKISLSSQTQSIPHAPLKYAL
jgi:hypothetical protein